MATLRERFGRELRAELTRRRLSYREVQALTGISFSQVGDLCAGRVRTRAQIEKLAAGLGLNPAEWLLKAGFVPADLAVDTLLAVLLRLGEVAVVRPEALRAPTFERVSAGLGATVAEAPSGRTQDALAPFDYTVRVCGDSMTGVLEDGDIAFIKAQSHASPGDLVVALVREEAVVKRLRHNNGMVTLASANERYEDIPAMEVRILGVVTGVYRRP